MVKIKQNKPSTTRVIIRSLSKNTVDMKEVGLVAEVVVMVMVGLILGHNVSCVARFDDNFSGVDQGSLMLVKCHHFDGQGCITQVPRCLSLSYYCGPSGLPAQA
ncbi:hypothetical protein J1N35_000779 [Gossypium stocksii]|uniref:Uncharacterized protein n=1 Tax=Gossypium stocksii TaxID=47602 RepID=A0A9D3WI38_9ROSI|nr:hypothetical protein J1N35_000779 [Gossypium stocksii]